MAELPLLVFPTARVVEPPKGRGFRSGKPHSPTRSDQAARLAPQLQNLQDSFFRYKASLSANVAGLEPETVLVIEIAGSVDNFKQAIDSTTGLEWLGEWDVDDVAPDEYFWNENEAGEKTDKTISGRLFLSFGNEQGLRELLNLWKMWGGNKPLPRGKTKWRDVFSQLRTIRPWGIEETLGEAHMLERWQDLVASGSDTAQCQIELFYRRNPEQRRQNEQVLNDLLSQIDGRLLGTAIDQSDIAFHAVKAELPTARIQQLLTDLAQDNRKTDIQLFMFAGIMYFRPTGQSLTATEGDEGEIAELPLGSPDLPPVVAILDGVPNVLHNALVDRVDFEDADNLAAEYQAGEKRHGTAMASLVIHGELRDGQDTSLTRKVYQAPIMQPNPQARAVGKHEEYIPSEVFLEDRIERAVKRMLEGEGGVPAQASRVKVINLSFGDGERPFIRTPSPLARLLDWLSWKYRVLFCVSAGNFVDAFNIGMPYAQFTALSDAEKIKTLLKAMEHQLFARRLLSPAESINALTVGGLHADESGNAYAMGNRVDLLPNNSLLSPISRLGHGFRRSIKPELMFYGGRQLYHTPIRNTETTLNISAQKTAPGQKVAWDSAEQGDLSKTVYTCGTSNATALATRGGARIYEVLSQLQEKNEQQIPDDLVAVLIKALLVHGAKHDQEAKQHLVEALKNEDNSRKFKTIAARYMGYGAVDIERVLACTEQRVTVLGFGEIKQNEIHEYRFPLPMGLSAQKVWRRMVVTLAWFSPINPDHRNLREAKLEFSASEKWDETSLRLSREDSDYDQVQRGTVQHEILEGESQLNSFQEGDSILLHVRCKADATDKLDEAIPYGLAVTLEIAEGIQISIYQQIKARIQPPVLVGTGNNGSQ